VLRRPAEWPLRIQARSAAPVKTAAVFFRPLVLANTGAIESACARISNAIILFFIDKLPSFRAFDSPYREGEGRRRCSFKIK
jgi:hypothetical protein